MQVHEFWSPSSKNKRERENKTFKKKFRKTWLIDKYLWKRQKIDVFEPIFYCWYIELTGNENTYFTSDDLNRNGIQIQEDSERCREIQRVSTLFLTGETTPDVL